MSDSADDAKNMITDIVSEYDELAKLFPYANHVITAYKFIRVKRMEWFLKALSTIHDTLSPQQQEYFKKLLESQDGREILSEYADSVINTSSKTANIGLALLYSDAKHEWFPKPFKALAAMSLKGITEELIDLFLALSQNFHKLRTSNEGPYLIYFCTQDFISHSPELNNELRNPDVLISSMDELIRRRLFAPDYATARLADDDFSFPFGITDTSLHFQDLLTEAKDISKQLR